MILYMLMLIALYTVFKCPDVFDNVVVPNKEQFDVSDMQRKHLQDNINKKVLGKF